MAANPIFQDARDRFEAATLLLKLKKEKGSGDAGTHHLDTPFLSFKEAHTFALGLNLPGKGSTSWRAWCKGGNRPLTVPSNPDRTYIGKGWLSWDHWIGQSISQSRIRVIKTAPKPRFEMYFAPTTDIRYVLGAKHVSTLY